MAIPKIIDIDIPQGEEDWINLSHPNRNKGNHAEIVVGIDVPTDDFNIRPAVPRGMRREVLYNSNRACCICRKKPKAVYLHHINNDRYSHSHANLIVLCTLHHDMVHGRNKLGKRIPQHELRRHKREWESTVKKNRELTEQKKLINKEIEVIISPTDVLAPPTSGTNGKSPNLGIDAEYNPIYDSTLSILSNNGLQQTIKFKRKKRRS